MKELVNLPSVFLFHFLPHMRKLSYYFFQIMGFRFVNVCGSKMLVDMEDKGISYDLYLRRIREIPLTDFFLKSKAVCEGDTILDIGANIGYYSLIFSKLVGEKGSVYAIEPVNSNLSVLNLNLKENNAKNVKSYRLAFSDSEGISRIYVPDRRNWACMNRENIMGNNIREEIVNVTTVDSFLNNKPQIPKLVRMDVEGHEYNILRGME